MRLLDISAIDEANCGLSIAADISKNRKADFLPVPAALLGRLKDFAESGEALRLYKEAYRYDGIPPDVPERPIFYVPVHVERSLYHDLEAAGIQRETIEGLVDSPDLRGTFVSRILESGADVKTAMDLARHSTPTLTLNVYGRSRWERRQEVIERLGDDILAPERGQIGDKLAVGAENCLPDKELGYLGSRVQALRPLQSSERAT
ncbi:MAG: hypothetical protein N3A66_12215 [Planctomycetota bacterium]|nr:hypothetical protein [Planctomycetota bacterium]